MQYKLFNDARTKNKQYPIELNDSIIAKQQGIIGTIEVSEEYDNIKIYRTSYGYRFSIAYMES